MTTMVVSSLFNANVYLNGNDLLGRAAEVEIPQPKQLMQEYRGMGMIGRMEIPVGMDKLDATIKWSSFDLQILINTTASLANATISVMGDVQVLSSAGVSADLPAIMNMTGIIHDPGPLIIKAQANTEFSTKMTVWHVETYLEGLQVYLYDVMSNQFIVNGVDQLAIFRANIGG